MRVLHLSDGLPMIPISRALRARGIGATSCHFYANRYGFTPDLCLCLERFPAEKRQQRIRDFFELARSQYDIFHFHFGFTFFPDKSDLRLLKAAGKKVIVHHQGSEARLLSEAAKRNPYVKGKPYWTEERIRNDLSRLSAYADQAIVAYHELTDYVKDYYRKVHVVLNPVETAAYAPRYPNPLAPEPLIVHAPTDRDLKGSEAVIRAVQQLRKEGYRFRFRLIEHLPHQTARAVYAQADLVVDQLRIGDYGVVSIEAMALGKPVICHMRPDLAIKYPGLPIVSANPDTIVAVLRRLLNDRSRWVDIGRRGRAYAVRHHDIATITDALIAIYRQL